MSVMESGQLLRQPKRRQPQRRRPKPVLREPKCLLTEIEIIDGSPNTFHRHFDVHSFFPLNVVLGESYFVDVRNILKVGDSLHIVTYRNDTWQDVVAATSFVRVTAVGPEAVTLLPTCPAIETGIEHETGLVVGAMSDGEGLYPVRRDGMEVARFYTRIEADEYVARHS